MTTRITLIFLTIGLLLASLQGMTCQELFFKNGIQRYPPIDGPGNWTAAGRLHLTDQDTIIFEPLVRVQAVTEVCSISLKSCVAHGQAPPKSDTEACYCTEGSHEDFDLHVSSRGDLSGRKVTVQATVPSSYMFNPLSLAATIGEVPGADQQFVTFGALPGRVKALEESLEAMAAKLKNADNTNSHLNTKNSQLTTENSQLIKQIGQLTSQNSQLTSKNSQLSKQLSKKDGEEAAKLKKADDTIILLQTQNSLLTIQNSQLTNQNSLVTGQNSQLTSQNSELLAQLTKKDEEMGSQITSMATMMTELNKTSETIDEIHDMVLPSTCDAYSPDSRPIVSLPSGIVVVCDTTTDNGGWILFQRRVSNSTDFYRGWSEYKTGFGDLKSNFWLGLEKIHYLTTRDNYELRVDITYGDAKYYAVYSNFRILGEGDNYKLVVSGYSGTAGDCLAISNGWSFTTRDRDHDSLSIGNCAQLHAGAWWYNHCDHSNLNGLWAESSFKGITWYTTTGDNSATVSEMKIRPIRP